MTDRIQLGVIGCGGIARGALVPQAAAIPEFRLRAFCDVVESKAAEMCQAYEGVYHCTDVQRMLDDAELDAVLICTLPDTHAPLACAFLGRNKHVFVQKPIAVSYDQCRALVQAERDSSAKAMAAYCYRLSPLVQRIRESIPNPRLIYARMMSKDLLKSHPHYLEIPGLDGLGPMLELACHNVDLAYWLAGAKPRRVSAHGGNMRHPGKNILDNFVLTIEFENGAVATLINGDCGAPVFEMKWQTEVFGDEVTAVNEGFRRLVLKGRIDETTEYAYNTGIGLDRDMAVFRDVIFGKTICPAPLREGVVASLLMLKGQGSLSSGLPQAIDLSEWIPE